MRKTIAAALGLPAAAALHAQGAVDLSYAMPVAGNWVYAPLAGGSEARFVDSANRTQLTIRCARATRSIAISKPASAPITSVSLWTSSAERTLPATFDVATGQVTAQLAASDALLDALAFSRGRFAVMVPGAPPLVLPPWPEPTRVIEDCRA